MSSCLYLFVFENVLTLNLCVYNVCIEGLPHGRVFVFFYVKVFFLLSTVILGLQQCVQYKLIIILLLLVSTLALPG